MECIDVTYRKPKKIGHTSNPQFIKMERDLIMESLRDRTVRIDVPHLLRWSDELNILEQASHNIFRKEVQNFT